MTYWWECLQNLLGFNQSFSVVPAYLDFLFRLSNIPELLPTLLLIVGIVTVFLPRKRAAYIERRYGLADPDPSSVVFQEIAHFVHQYDSSLHIKANMLRSDQIAFIYPLGYRTAALAVFGGLIKRWRSDRSAAEAIVLHEIAHHRHGDILIVGTGSFFEYVAKQGLVLFLILGVTPLLIAFVSEHLLFFQEMRAMGVSPSIILGRIGSSIFLSDLPAIILMLVFFPFFAASILVLPILGIWCAEISADRFVVDATDSLDALLNALDPSSQRVSWWRWLLFRLTHPPTALRRWMIKNANRPMSLVLLLLLFPLGYLIKLMLLVCWSFSLAGSANIAANIRLYLTSTLPPLWLIITGVLLIWPMFARSWERFFIGSSDASSRNSYLAYAISAGVIGIIAIYLLVLS